MALWFETKIRYDKVQKNGTVKKVNEPYLVDALTFTEAESRIIDAISPYISSEFSVSAVKKTKVSEIFFNEKGDRYYMAKVAFITMDEKTEVEKRSVSYILVQASDLKDAIKVFEEGMKGSMADWELTSMAESPLMDVFPMKYGN